MSYFKVIEGLKTVLQEDSRIKTVTEGDIDDLDQYRQNIPAIAHIVVDNGVLNENLNQYNVDIYIIDYVTENNNITTEKFKGNSNRQEVYNDMINVSRRVFKKLRSFAFGDNIHVQDAATFDKIYQFETDNRLAGWRLSFLIDSPDIDIDICETI